MSIEQSVVDLLSEIVQALGDDERSPSLTVDRVRAREIVEALAPVAMAPDPAIDWVVANARRVDVGVSATGEREWRIVCSIDASGVHSATVIERPEPFTGVPGGRAVIVNGPSSAGKSTVMAAVVAGAPTPWVMFDEIFFGSVPTPFLVWPDRAPTLRPGFIDGIAALARAGNQVITTGGARAEFGSLIEGVPTLLVGLDCPLKMRVARQQARADRWGGLTESSESAHEGWTYDLRYDTSKTTAAEIALDIIERAATP